MSNPNEEQFEQSICDWLQNYGWYVAIKNDLAQGAPTDFNPALGLDTGELFTFLGATQANPWNELIKRYGGDQPTAQHKFADRLTRELDKRGTVDVLRHGVVDLGVIPVATAELKNPLTGQGVEHAVTQFRSDRDPKNRTLIRAVVHFAVTVFLPFNQGDRGGAGNPPNPYPHAAGPSPAASPP